MDINTNSTIKRSLDIKKLLPLLLILILVLAVLFLLFRQFFLNNTQDSDNTDTSENEVIYLDVEDKSKVRFNDVELSLPTGWSVITYVNEPSYRSLTCNSLISSSQENSCLIYEINDGELSFYLSSPVSLVNLDNPRGEIRIEKINFLDNEVNLNIEELDLYTENDEGILVLDENSKYVKLAYLCSGEVCLSSGKLSLDVEESNSILSKFKELILKF